MHFTQEKKRKVEHSDKVKFSCGTWRETVQQQLTGKSLFNFSDGRRWKTTQLSLCPNETQKTETAEEALSPKQTLSAKEKNKHQPGQNAEEKKN